MQKKQCCKCSEVKNIDEFYPDKRYSDNRRSYCKDCDKLCATEATSRKMAREGRLYWVWVHLKSDLKQNGIYIHPDFMEYASFKDWAKDKYCKGKELNRKDRDYGYSPWNCEFVSHAERTRNNSTTELTWPDVREIRDRYENTSITQEELSLDYPVSETQIWRIVNYKEWLPESFTNLKLDEEQIDKIYQQSRYLPNEKIAEIWDINPDSVAMVVSFSKREREREDAS